MAAGRRRWRPAWDPCVQRQDAEFYRDNIEFPFFLYYLKTRASPGCRSLHVRDRSQRVAQARCLAAKQARPKTFYFQAGGKLSASAPPRGDASMSTSAIRTSLPLRRRDRAEHGHHLHGRRPALRLFADRRSGLPTEPLEADLRVAGPLKVSCMSPPRAQIGLGGEADRRLSARLPRSRSAPAAGPAASVKMEATSNCSAASHSAASFDTAMRSPSRSPPGKWTRSSSSYRRLPGLRRGHRFMIHVQSSWFPLVDRNTQEVPSRKPARLRATQRVYRSGNKASGMQLLVIE